MASNEILYIIKADITNINTRLEEVEKKLNQVGTQGKNSFGGITASVMKLARSLGSLYVLNRFINAMKHLVNLSERQAQAELFLARSLKNVTTEVGNNVEYLKKLAAEYQKLTGVGDETILGFAGMLSTFQLNSRQIAELIPRILDMGKALEMTTGRSVDYNSIAIAVGKAIQGQTGILARYGVVLDKQAIKTDKFNGILKSLDMNFKGAAKAAGETFTGEIQKLKATFSDMGEKIGDFIKTGLQPYLNILNRIIDVMRMLGRAREYDNTAMGRYEQALKRVNQLRREGKEGTEEYKKALIELRVAKQNYLNEVRKEVAEKQRVKKLTTQVTQAEEEHLEVIEESIKVYEGALVSFSEFSKAKKYSEMTIEQLSMELVNVAQKITGITNPYEEQYLNMMAELDNQTVMFGKTWERVAADVVRDIAYMSRSGELSLGNLMRKIAQVIVELMTYYAIVSSTGSTEMAKAGSMLAGTLVGMFQEGGVVEKPTLAVVGEAGREYIIPERKLNNLVEAIVDKVGYSRPVTVEVRLDNMVSLSDSRVQRVIARAVQKGQRDLRMIGG